MDEEYQTLTFNMPQRAALEQGEPVVGRQYFVVFEGEQPRLVELPPTGDVMLGRAETGAVVLRDVSISRRHAKVTMTDGEARLSDLGSHNGTYVNGERIERTRLLSDGDAVAICGATLVFHAEVRPRRRREIGSSAHLRPVLEHEIDRALQCGRSFAVALLDVPADADRKELGAGLASRLRMIDFAGWGDDGALTIVMPELGVEEAQAICRGILSSLQGDVRIGFAVCPRDACDVDGLLSQARAALSEAQPGKPLGVAEKARVLNVAGRKIVVSDAAMTRVYSLIERLAPSPLAILVCGETGSGKELAAAALHHWSARSRGPFVPVNCAAIPENLVESELFGYERGAFTGAVAPKEGLLETADGGTIFLDEVGELPLGAQAKLLRVLEERAVFRLGDVKGRAVDLRIVAATNRNLADEVRERRFRQDLFYRLSGAMVRLPPLRERPAEIALLARTFLAEACDEVKRAPLAITETALHLLLEHSWPGNVRELKNLMTFLAATIQAPAIEPGHLADRIELGWGRPLDTGTSGDPTRDSRFRPIDEEIRELERRRMMEAMEASGGNKTRAAELIGMPLRTFVTKSRLYDLRRPDPPAGARAARR